MGEAYRCDECGQLDDLLGDDQAPLVITFSRVMDVQERTIYLCPECADEILDVLLEVGETKHEAT